MAANSSYVPSSTDLLMVVPRLARKLLSVLPENIDSLVAKVRSGGSVIAEATSSDMMNKTSSITTAFAKHASNIASSPVAASAASAATAAAAATGPATSHASETGFMSYLTLPFSFESARGFGGMFSYLGSRWALTTFALSILLNRTQFYASSRQNLTLQWSSRLLLYSVPIMVLLMESYSVLQALKCQTSPDYAMIRYGDSERRLAINFGVEGGALYHFASKLLFWKNDNDCCAAVNMALVGDNQIDVMGSFALIWPVFLSLCFSQFIETMSCALQGRHVLPETGMTLFEHSLSFAECENMITSALDLHIFGRNRASASNTTASSESDTSSGPLLTKAMLLQRLNAPPEVLIVCLISCLSHLSSSVLAVIGQRERFRLVNTAIWATCYMSAFIWSFAYVFLTPTEDMEDLGVLRFPTVCIIGFIPHLLILAGISVCATIYTVALIVTATSLPADMATNPTITQRLRLAHNNLQANIQFSSSSSIKLNWSEDFYTTLLKVGFSILTAASEAVYLNEGSKIRLHPMTWVEEKRLNELSARNKTRLRVQQIPTELLGERIAKGLEFTDAATVPSQSGFARERRSKSGQAATKSTNADSGLGIAERRGRWQLTFEFVKSVKILLAQTVARLFLRFLATLSIRRVPRWLQRIADYSIDDGSSTSKNQQRAETPDFWLVSDNGSLMIPDNANVDVETEMRRRLRAVASGVDPSEEEVDSDLYDWWKQGGWWGDVDGSGEYSAREVDDDTTSMVSMSSAASDVFSTEEDSGRRTPTQDDYMPYSREQTPDRTFGVSDLARLLDPKTPQDKEEARMLSRRLQNDQAMTRSQYCRQVTRDKARLLSASFDEQNSTSNELQTEAEEEAALEHFILERRAKVGSNAGQGASWDSGAEGMGSSGPQCVVCQSNPRVILVWPCGCLSICDDCRVGVAMRNFNNCMTCRTAVTAYSRLYVP